MKDDKKNAPAPDAAPAAIFGPDKDNRFSRIFADVAFKHIAKPGEPLSLRGGGSQIRLSQCLLELGFSGSSVWVPGAHVVLRINGDGAKRIMLQLPTTGSKDFRNPVFDTQESEAASEDLDAFSNWLVQTKWTPWRKGQVAAGLTAKGFGGAVRGMSPDANLLADLGYGADIKAGEKVAKEGAAPPPIEGINPANGQNAAGK